MRKYTIFYYKTELNKGIYKMFLVNMRNFGHATNLTFNSVDHAINFIKTYDISGPICAPLRIQGPKGSVYCTHAGRLVL